MSRRPSLTLGQALLLTMAGLLAAFAFVFLGFMAGSREALETTAQLVLQGTGREVATRIESYLGQADEVVGRIEDELRLGVLDVRDARELRRVLVGEVGSHPALSEVTFTTGRFVGQDEDGFPQLDPKGRRQLSVWRQGDELRVRDVHQEGRGFVSVEQAWRDGAWRTLQKAPAEDPTDHPTFRTPARSKFRGQSLWSDLYYHEADRRPVVSVQKAVEGQPGRLAGVLRVALGTRDVDDVQMFSPGGGGPGDPHRVFLVTSDWGFLTRFAAQDPVREVEGNLRIVPERVPEAVQAVADHVDLASLKDETVGRIGPYLYAFQRLPRSQDWIVGVVVPEDHYLGALLVKQRIVLRETLGIVLAALLLGWLALRRVHRDLNRLVESSNRMQDFDFSPARAETCLRDVRVVEDSLETTKTAMRTMSKYAPVELVRRIFHENREPELGGELRDVTLLFTDLEGFSTLAERLPIDELAERLGEYLERMNAAVAAVGGTVLERVGDALLVSWNAPVEQPDHARRGLEAVLSCLAMEPTSFRTRFGVHTDRVMVGHFGARDRMNYGVMGDGVNLAARLESLNKQYGTRVLVSGPARQAAGEGYAWRLVDVVAVKGRNQGVEVHELLGRSGRVEPAMLELARAYEEALALYREGRFAEAGAAFDAVPGDPPAAVLAARCRELAAHPPADWTGVHVARSK